MDESQNMTSVLARSWPGQRTPHISQLSLQGQLAAFEPIALAEMAGAVLLDRSEAKYLLPEVLLPSVLAELRDEYRVLEVSGRRLSRYRTLYFDTDDLTLYRRHHDRAVDRYKVRAREYVDSHAAYFEVKHKTGRRHTQKTRIPTSVLVTSLTSQTAGFLADNCPYPVQALSGRLWNYYTRITLVSRRRPERVTLDLDLSFSWGQESVVLPPIVVAEVKYVGSWQESIFARVMHAHHVRSTGFSKYCMGVSLLYPEVKHNRFKAKQRMVARLTQGVENELS